jgi:iron(III) transport system ATP-binding protein
MEQPALQVEGLEKWFGRVCAVNQMSFRVARGQILALFGPSGCGKTTALRLVAGFERPDGGRVEIDGQRVAGGGVYVPPERRRVGIVFQDYALFPHFTVADNVAFGLPRSGNRARHVEALLEQVGLGGLGHRWPHQLSGGQQQRVALARALAPRPRLLLLDEPFSNLDAALRARVRVEVRAILAEAGLTAIFVTHDRDEALSLADEVAVLEAGRILQIGPPDELYRSPASPIVAAAVADADFLDATAQDTLATCEIGTVRLAHPAQGAVRVLLRPEFVALERHAEGHATVQSRQFFGADQLLAVALPSGAVVRARLPSDRDFPIGERVNVEPLVPLLPYPVGLADQPQDVQAAVDVAGHH